MRALPLQGKFLCGERGIMDYKIVIGLEVHVQLKTATKMFCGCPTLYGMPPNKQTCPVCLGLPGVLPVINKKAVELAVKAALALNCSINSPTKFDRKNYFYPDLPKNYQISQYDLPLGKGGHLEIGKGKKIGITRAHLEEDSGKSIHEETKERKDERTGNNSGSSVSPFISPSVSLVDLNRTGVPLLEIVSEPEISSPEEAYQYLTTLKELMIYLGISDCDMEKGSLRCDANISILPEGETKLRTKTEVKNLNSFKFVAKALEFEAARQIELLKSGKEVEQETRLWDETANETRRLRGKEAVQDYRYFPEPDLKPITISPEWISDVKKTIPELPTERRARFVRDYQLPEYDAGVLTQSKAFADFFEEWAKVYPDNIKAISNLFMGPILQYLNKQKIGIEDLKPKLKDLVFSAVAHDQGKITNTSAQAVIGQILITNRTADQIIQEEGLGIVNDQSVIEGFARQAIEANPKIVADYKGGKKAAIQSLVGQVMRLSKGKANPELAKQALEKQLGS